MGQSQSNVSDRSKEQFLHENEKNNDTDKKDENEKNGSLTAPYDDLDKLQASLPSLIDEESRQQVEDYIQACDNGKGPMVACFASAEYMGMFERKVRLISIKNISNLLFGCICDSHLCLTSHPTILHLSTKKLSSCLRMFAFGQKPINHRMERKWMVQR